MNHKPHTPQAKLNISRSMTGRKRKSIITFKPHLIKSNIVECPKHEMSYLEPLWCPRCHNEQKNIEERLRKLTFVQLIKQPVTELNNGRT